jgi:broad specificity phosphatase PhoE
MKFVLVRHGAIEWSAAARHTGRTDLALTAQGREQAESAKSNVLSAIDDLRDGPAITRWNELASERS